jgi:hypothetical protein
MNSAANATQIGGSHYKTEGVQHWDIVDTYEVCYLAGCATKYLTRFRRKNGLQDLQKAQHYIAKMIEARGKYHGRTEGDVPEIALQTFLADNGITGIEREPIRLVFNWTKPAQLKSAAAWVEALIEEFAGSTPTGSYVNQDR